MCTAQVAVRIRHSDVRTRVASLSPVHDESGRCVHSQNGVMDVRLLGRFHVLEGCVDRLGMLHIPGFPRRAPGHD
jgi:hypothetical protein